MKKLLIAIILATATLAGHAVAENNSVICLAKNIYHEARGEPLAGKLAVAKVTINRVESRQFADTICGVVYERGQFSWTANRSLKVRDRDAWEESLNIARDAVHNGLDEIKLSALYFHSAAIKPKPAKKRITKIGKHVFY